MNEKRSGQASQTALMFSRRPGMSRRRVLRGLGTAPTLPFLNAMAQAMGLEIPQFQDSTGTLTGLT